MNRRDFLYGATTAALLGSTLLACGDEEDDTGTDDTGTDDTGDTNVTCTISSASGDADSHGHTLSIPQADLEAPADTSYTSSTASGHSHTVSLTAAELQTLADTCTVTVSSNDSHAHTWVLTIG